MGLQRSWALVSLTVAKVMALLSLTLQDSLAPGHVCHFLYSVDSIVHSAREPRAQKKSDTFCHSCLWLGLYVSRTPHIIFYVSHFRFEVSPHDFQSRSLHHCYPDPSSWL